ASGQANNGGGIRAFGTVLITGGSITGNTGFGIALGGAATLNGVSITDNSVGGGLRVSGNLTTNLINCLIANNTNSETGGGGGGGIFNSGTINAVNTTISGNSTPGSGGGILTFNANLTLTNVTVTNNRASQGGGIVATGFVLLKNTIMSGNFSGASPSTTPDDIQFLIQPSSSFNLIGTCNSCGVSNGVNNNQVGVTNPGLGPLANNGGPTQTHAILAGSSALDAGSNSFVVNPPFIGPSFTDQRGTGFNRIVDGPDADTIATVDIGACETQVTLENIADAVTNEDTQIIIPFEIDDRASITSITATSDNQTLVPNDPNHILVTDAGATEVITINPAANLFGTADITVTVNRTSGSANRTFTLTVNSVNDAPSFTKGLNQTINEDAGPQVVSNWATNLSAGPSDESAQTLNFQVTNNTNAGLFSSAPAISSTGTLTYTPAANANGSATITIVLKDNGGMANGGADTSAAQSFTITVNPVNDAPSFTDGPDQSVNEDSGPRTVPNWATNISAGPPDESGQTLTFEITTNTNPALFSSAPAINSAGMLTFTPAPNANGSATILIVLKDNGGVANGGQDTSGFRNLFISVTPANDAPSFTKGPDQTVNNNAGAQTVNNWATGISAGPANESGQTLTFQVTGNSNPGLFAVAPAVSSTGTLTYTPATNAGGTATVTIVLKDNGGTINGGQDTSPAQTFNINVTPVGGFLQFESSSFTTTESSTFTIITVKRTGDTARPVAINFATGGNIGTPCPTATGVASSKCDFTSALGTLNFAAGEDTKTFTVLISQDSYVEGPETLNLSLETPTGFAALGVPSTATLTIEDDISEPATNPIDDPGNFVRQHYHDFLNREPDAAGLAFWTNEITSCGTDPQCIEIKRINVSAAFFLSIEFQETGYLVYRMYKAAYGDTTSPNVAIPVPIIRLNEFLPDAQSIGKGVRVGIGDWEAQLEANKTAFAQEFVGRARFLTDYPLSMSATEFVDKLNLKSGGVLSPAERDQLIAELIGAPDVTAGRANVVRKVAEDADMRQRETNRAFVLMQYYGYLRRNPDDPQDTDFRGWEFWLNKLNQFNGNFINAEMVKAFINSIEYRQRFGG
ncbi:MAG TPA: Ig-like domain-containing protein, partial [Pyrinomonadaceae bacterium]|nr:Ig-like domain-containing protein [Pyrinomonadaceae bacterium]